MTYMNLLWSNILLWAIWEIVSQVERKVRNGQGLVMKFQT